MRPQADNRILRNINYVHMHFLSTQYARPRRSYWKTALRYVVQRWI